MFINLVFIKKKVCTALGSLDFVYSIIDTVNDFCLITHFGTEQGLNDDYFPENTRFFNLEDVTPQNRTISTYSLDGGWWNLQIWHEWSP